jgi:DNA helicase-2/ATP-dependent DNA helicase PcrA
MLRFEKDFKDTKIILLEENYRSTKNILDAANGVIAKNIYRKEKNLFTSNESGEKIGLYVAMDEGDEAGHIAQSIAKQIESGVSPDGIAILYRANFQSRALEDACLFNNIPYHVLGTKFFDRKEVKDALSYIKLALNPDSGADLKRVINTPVRGIGKTTVLKVLEGKRNELTDSFKIKVNTFYSIIQDIRNHALHHAPSEVVKFMLTRSGIEQELKQDDEEERLENVRELVSLAKRYDEKWNEYMRTKDGTPDAEGEDETTTAAAVALDPFSDENPKHALSALEKFIEDASLLGEQDTLDDKQERGATVKLMTVHASKGLEFNYVYVTGLEKDLFPHMRHGGDGTQAQVAPEDAEEERRLFYVALTRARKKLHLSYALIRTIFGSKVFNQASEFIEDIDQSLIESENPGGEMGGGLLGRLIEF